MTLESPKSRRDEYSEATRAALLAAAKKLFTAGGYQATGIEAVAQASRVTRGALYHHFADKRALFDALVVELQSEAAAAVLKRVGPERDRWTAMRVGTEAFLDVCTEPAYLRLVIQEAPAVLGLARYREIDEAHTRGLLIQGLKELKKSGDIDFDDIELLSSMIAAAECQAALLMPDAKDRAALKKAALDALDRIVGAFRPRRP
ncbi:MAG: TetR/AcrR family transcriptional regulator [Parvibaculum sp.]|uniref:TetR/AcrR family transcriptional regulator n=1 Tax=Parvibaculum sp. TaxID=2024848 RepID=UPI0025DAE66A|nr:TetR/AcrR family transcriptional regulator [Parvibaculum sp.]MCE9650356.1 TetR/AcrR family transcriptional regulator [Parvibaculum sp.]